MVNSMRICFRSIFWDNSEGNHLSGKKERKVYPELRKRLSTFTALNKKKKADMEQSTKA